LDDAEQWERFESWQQTAFLCSLIANTNRDPKKKSSPFEPKDFNPIPVPGEEGPKQKKQQTPEEMAHVAKMLCAAMGGKIG